jgi:hypothetical protein
MDSRTPYPKRANDSQQSYRNNYEDNAGALPDTQNQMPYPENETFPLGDVPSFRHVASSSSLSLTPTTYTEQGAADPFDEDEKKPLTGAGMSRYPPVTYVRLFHFRASFLGIIS